MAVKRLGKGLGALIPDLSESEVHRSERLRDVEVSRVVPNPFQPRETFDPVTLEELKQSIAENGVIQPITVREMDSGYQLIAGERRLRAVKDLGLDRIPAYVLQVNTDAEMLELSLIENIQRENLNPIDEANGYQALIIKCHLTQDEVAKKVGKDRSTVTNFLRLLKLPKLIQESLVAGEVSTGHARALLALPSSSDQIALWKKSLSHKLSVRQVESLIKKLQSPEKKKQPRKEGNPFFREIEDRFRSILGTQVRIIQGSKGGKIEIEYYSKADIERILELMERI
ncbi:MAG TPA: ParB/RepB/Spo0J family partition protein [bacterium]